MRGAAFVLVLAALLAETAGVAARRPPRCGGGTFTCVPATFTP
jgi:hypothetical protein